MPTFKHKRHNRTRTVSGAQAERFRASPSWSEIAEDGSDSAVSSAAAPDSGTADLNVPDGTVAQVLDWAGDDADRKAAALYAERQGKKRSTLLDALAD